MKVYILTYTRLPPPAAHNVVRVFRSRFAAERALLLFLHQCLKRAPVAISNKSSQDNSSHFRDKLREAIQRDDAARAMHIWENCFGRRARLELVEVED